MLSKVTMDIGEHNSKVNHETIFFNKRAQIFLGALQLNPKASAVSLGSLAMENRL